MVSVGIQDQTGEWRDAEYAAEAPDLPRALEAGRQKGWEENPYAQDVRHYGAQVITTRSRPRRVGLGGATRN
jgi:hypothetical protein